MLSSWGDVKSFDLPGCKGFTKSPMENFDKEDKRWLRRVRRREKLKRWKVIFENNGKNNCLKIKLV